MTLPFGADGLHFLRPLWLWALLALPLIAWLWTQRRRRDNAWRGSVDAHLLPHLLEPASNVRTRSALGAVLLAWLLASLALAGPAWKQVPQPAWQSRTPLVIALDLSSAITANDLPPSRLLQARAKIATLLRERNGGQVGLIVFADDAYTVAPLTDDAANLALYLEALAPDVMPLDGHRPDRAIRRAATLLQQAGFDRGDILLLTDHGDTAAQGAAADAARKGMQVSVLGLGTARGGTAQAPDGSIARVALDPASLQALASAGGGTYAAVSPGDGDLRALGVLQPQGADAVSTQGRAGRAWEDAGYWLLPPLMLLALFAFRRGAGVATLCVALLMPPLLLSPDVAHAQSNAPAGTLWRRADQIAAARMEAGEAVYRRGDFAGATSAYDGIPVADAHYNLGNALAKQGRYDDAIAAYDAALRAQPGMPDALANKRAVEAAKKRKPPPGQGQRKDPGAQGKQQDGKPSQSQADAKAQQPPSPKNAQKPPQPSQQQQPAPSQQADKPADAQSQRAADAAQRARMQQALEKQGKQDPASAAAQARARKETPAERERRLANEAWLRRVPDDPGSLLRAKFRLEYERRQLEGGE